MVGKNIVKLCSKCLILKEPSEFSERKDRSKKYPDIKKYSSSCKKCLREAEKDYRNKNKEKTKLSNIKCTHGLGEIQYRWFLEKQNYKCKICDRKRPLCVDHNHKTGKIRGLLCKKCNTGIGHLEDNIDFLKKSITYLEEDLAYYK